MLDLRDISKSYAGHACPVHALRDVSLRVDAGTFLAVQGPSGCGKTTLLLIAGGLLAPDAGHAHLGDRDIYALSPEERAGVRAESIGFVFQQFHLVPYLSVHDNIVAPCLAQPQADADARAKELLERFALGARRDHLPAELSTGERQRTALARALMNRPRLLLADEPTGNLDEENACIVLDALVEFAGRGGAVLMVSHDPRIAERAENILRMRDGKMCDSNAKPPIEHKGAPSP